MLTTEQGYRYAARADVILNEALQAHDIEEAESYAGYCSLLRTLRTSLDIMERANNKHAPKLKETAP
jgi:hypothetical protein